MTYYTTIESPLGQVLLAAQPAAGADSPPALTLAHFVGQRHAVPIGTEWRRDDVLLQDAASQFMSYFEGARTTFDVPISLRGSEFQCTVWRGLLDIPYGTTWSYGELAAKVADRSKTRAVAAAVGRNPIGVLVPCHRVIGADGSLTGFAGGLERKRWLLDHEAEVAGSRAGLFAG